MDAKLLETLLWKSEGDTLDFKRDQYAFSGADDDVKCELLKDILAFANAWRTDDAYIIIGVKDKPGHRGEIRGVTDHLPEGNVQQLVNTKTNRPLGMSYVATSVDAKQVGIIKIDGGQRRPIYLKKDFGKLKAREVYVRRGSSTAIADPDEVAAMGSSDVQVGDPMVSFELAEHSGVRHGTDVNLTSNDVVTVPNPEDPDGDKIVRMAVALRAFGHQPGQQALKGYRVEMARLNLVRFYLKNESGTPVEDAKAKLVLPNDPRLRLHDENTLPDGSLAASLATSPQASGPPSLR